MSDGKRSDGKGNFGLLMTLLPLVFTSAGAPWLGNFSPEESSRLTFFLIALAALYIGTAYWTKSNHEKQLREFQDTADKATKKAGELVEAADRETTVAVGSLRAELETRHKADVEKLESEIALLHKQLETQRVAMEKEKEDLRRHLSEEREQVRRDLSKKIEDQTKFIEAKLNDITKAFKVSGESLGMFFNKISRTHGPLIENPDFQKAFNDLTQIRAILGLGSLTLEDGSAKVWGASQNPPSRTV